MKATFDIPDELYRRVKARTALDGRPLRSVVVELFRKWLESPSQTEPAAEELTQAKLDAAPWLAITRRAVQPEMSHEMDDIREAISRGWAAETAQKIPKP